MTEITKDKPFIVDTPHDGHVLTKLDHEQREIWARLKERQNAIQPDTATDAEHKHYWELGALIRDCEDQIRELERSSALTPIEILSKKQQLGVLRGELAALEAQYEAPYVESLVNANTPAPVESIKQRRARYLELFEAEEKSSKRGALARLATRLSVDRSNLAKDIKVARTVRTEQKRSGAWTSQLVTDGKRKG
jgi:hypothetical protein